jgi:protein-tyrosine-phosphatase
VQFGIDASAHIPRPLKSIECSQYDRVIALDGEAHEELRSNVASKVAFWNIPDPWGGDPSEYDACALEVVRKIHEWSKSLQGRDSL